MLWLIVPVMFVTLLVLLFLAGSIYAVMRLIQVLPKYSYPGAWLAVTAQD